MTGSRPRLAITMGDASGIGPEIILKAWEHENLFALCDPFVIGDCEVLERAKAYVGSKREIHGFSQWPPPALTEGIRCLDEGILAQPPPLGVVNAGAGKAAYAYIAKAVDLANKQEIDGIVTGPINKEALAAGGCHHPGHTEILADLSNTTEFAMLLWSPQLKVAHVTTHKGLLDAIEGITPARVYSVIGMLHAALCRAGYRNPRIAVAAINPHAGENGLFGRGEEGEKILPAIAKAVEENIAAVGPIPADTVFFRTARGEFDAVVAMYHDQGHIPVKVLGFEAGVNITIGLPFIRTSVDHGTAFDIAGTGRADETSLIEAIKQAAALSGKRTESSQ